jgi:hypothetical protein
MQTLNTTRLPAAGIRGTQLGAFALKGVSENVRLVEASKMHAFNSFDSMHSNQSIQCIQCNAQVSWRHEGDESVGSLPPPSPSRAGGSFLHKTPRGSPSSPRSAPSLHSKARPVRSHSVAGAQPREINRVAPTSTTGPQPSRAKPSRGVSTGSFQAPLPIAMPPGRMSAAGMPPGRMSPGGTSFPPGRMSLPPGGAGGMPLHVSSDQVSPTAGGGGMSPFTDMSLPPGRMSLPPGGLPLPHAAEGPAGGMLDPPAWAHVSSDQVSLTAVGAGMSLPTGGMPLAPTVDEAWLSATRDGGTSVGDDGAGAGR